MELQPLAIDGALLMTPRVHGDGRGHFLEWFRADAFSDAVGHRLPLAQANCSVSARGTVRGIHFADVPPGQAKYITCVAGRIRDVIVDIRVGSPTYGQWVAVELSADNHQAVYLAEGLGHGFAALEDGSSVVYLCSEPYRPQGEHEVHPLDPELAIDWLVDSPQLSAKDAAAPTLAQARAAGVLPDYDTSRHYRPPR